MLIVALVLAVIGLAALVTAVVTSNELIAWVCIGASVIGVLLLIVDALRERSRGTDGGERDVVDHGGVDHGGVDHGGDDHGRDDHGGETTVIPAANQSEPAEDYPDEPNEVVSETEPSTVGDTHDDGSPEAKRD